MLGETYRFAPVIDMKYLYPNPSRLLDAISVGKNCKKQAFKVAKIDDRNKKDHLYYLWFIDNKLALPRGFIQPEARDSAIITLEIDEQFLLSHFENKIPSDFFDRKHVIDLFVSDVEYTIPENRAINDEKILEKDHSDSVYWIVTFSKDPC